MLSVVCRHVERCTSCTSLAAPLKPKHATYTHAPQTRPLWHTMCSIHLAGRLQHASTHVSAIAKAKPPASESSASAGGAANDHNGRHTGKRRTPCSAQAHTFRQDARARCNRLLARCNTANAGSPLPRHALVQLQRLIHPPSLCAYRTARQDSAGTTRRNVVQPGAT